MTFLPDEFNFGTTKQTQTSESFLVSLENTFRDISTNVNAKTDLILEISAPAGTPDANNNIPSTTDVDFNDGTIWIVQDGATGPITAEVYIKAQTIISGGNQTALWVRLA